MSGLGSAEQTAGEAPVADEPPARPFLGGFTWPGACVGPAGRPSPHLFDDLSPAAEQLPRRFSASIREGSGLQSGRASLVFEGTLIGDELRDNAWGDDGYRFHDVFHLANAAVLGWSPCLRRMLRRKRKSEPRVDEVEDGARAIVLEEAVVALIFDYCASHRWLDGRASVDREFLSLLMRLTAHLECAACGPLLWEQAIRDGAQAWRTLRNVGYVTMVGDMCQRRLASH